MKNNPTIRQFTICFSKKKLNFFFLFGFFQIVTILSANPPTPSFYLDEHTTPSGWIFNVYSLFSYYHYNSQPGNLEISFPYSLNTRTFPSVTTNKVFTAQSNDLVRKGKWVYPSVGIEVGKENFTVEAQLGFYLHNWSDNLYGGINYRFILKKYHADPNPYVFGASQFPSKKMTRNASCFPVKISIGIFYYQPLWKLGTIDIGDNQFKAIGYTMQSLDSSTIGSSGKVTVYFHQNIVALKPSFSIGYSPDGNRFDFSLVISPLINLSEIGGLRFYQTNTGLVDWAPRNGIDPQAVIPLNTFGLNAKFNGEQISSSPFHLKATMFTLKVGVRFVKS